MDTPPDNIKEGSLTVIIRNNNDKYKVDVNDDDDADDDYDDDDDDDDSKYALTDGYNNHCKGHNDGCANTMLLMMTTRIRII